MAKRINKWSHKILLKMKIKNMMKFLKKMKNSVTTINKTNKMLKQLKIYLNMKKSS